ncbi:O-antigen polymerase [Serratia fonticola]|uniref:O-antigen polymerase n=3 Tax=Serratia fonticola TaxID=47917 RepID=UPI003AAD6C96
MRTFYINPFYMFAAVFSVGMFLFQLELSTLYYSLGNGPAQLTMILIIISSVIFGVLYKVKLGRFVRHSTPEDSTKFNVVMVSLFIVFGVALEIAAAGVVPILMVISGTSYYYRDFGIASFHVFFLSYVSASAIVGFERFLLFRSKRNLLITFLGLLFSVLIVNRAAMMMILVPCFYLYLAQNKNVKATVFMVTLFIGMILLFGFLGDKRMKSSGYTDERPIFTVAKINSPLLESLPSGFTWFYVYISSPYANLLNQEKNARHGRSDAFEFMSIAILPDFISKRVDPTVRDRFPVVLVSPELTVTTGFGWALSSYGILGVVLTYIYMCFLIIFFTFVNRKKHVRSVAAILATTASLMVFDNMFVFAACVMQLILISVFSSRKLSLFGKTVNLL